MADNPAKYGFRWQQNRGGANMKPLRVRVASGYQAAPGAVNVDLNVGDPVKKVNDGTVALCAAGDATFGIVVGIGPYYVGAPINAMVSGGVSLPGGTTYGTLLERQSFIYIVPAADQIFEVDADDKTTFTTEATYNAAIGENVDITINQVAGDTHAYPKADISTHATTNTLVWRIVDLARWPGQDYSGANVKLLVTCNVVQQAPFQTTGV